MEHSKNAVVSLVCAVALSSLVTPAAAQSWPFIDVTAFGARGDNGITDNSVAFQAAFDAAKTTGIPIFIPNGDYYMSRSIDATTGWGSGGTDISKPVYHIIGATGPGWKSYAPATRGSMGVRIIGGDIGFPIWDFVGGESVEISNILFDTKIGTRPLCTILVGRNGPLSGGGRFATLSNVTTYGDYSLAGIATIQAEEVNVYRSYFNVGPSTGQTGFYASKTTSTIYDTIRSRYQPLTNILIGGQSLLTMEKCDFVNQYNTQNYGAVFEFLNNAKLNQIYTGTFYSNNVILFRTGGTDVQLNGWQMEFVPANFSGSSPTRGIHFGSSDIFRNFTVFNSQIHNIYGNDGAILDRLRIMNVTNSAHPGSAMLNVDQLTNSTIDPNVSGAGQVRTSGSANVWIGFNKGNITGAAQTSSLFIDDSRNIVLNNNQFLKSLNLTGSAYSVLGIDNGNYIKIGAFDYTSSGVLLYMGGNGGISATSMPARNLRGAATFPMAATVSVIFPNVEVDASFYVSVTCNTSEKHWVTNKTAGGFTLNSDNPLSTASCDWIMVR